MQTETSFSLRHVRIIGQTIRWLYDKQNATRLRSAYTAVSISVYDVSGAAIYGNVNQNMLPSGVCGLYPISPPIIITRLFDIYKPSPEPECCVEFLAS